jgi:hypothetical protein
MQVGWLLDGDLLGDHRDEYLDAIDELGHTARLVGAPDPPHRWDDVKSSYRDAFPRGACVVVHADIDLATRVRRDQLWTPGAFCTVEHFFWSHYACHLGKYLLNREYLMLPFGELARCEAFLFRTMGRADRLFIRPDSPLKTFTGQCASRGTFSADLEFMSFYEFPASSLVVVSPPQEIVAEWRFVVAGKNVVAGSQYKRDGKPAVLATVDAGAHSLAQTIAAEAFEPDPVWVMDICQTTDGAFHLLEIGAFSFADQYACNRRDVVREVSEVAVGLWQQANH